MKRFLPILLLAFALVPSIAHADAVPCADTLIALRVSHQAQLADAAFACLDPSYASLLGASSADALRSSVTDSNEPASTPTLADMIDVGDGITLSVYLDHGDKGPFAWYVWTGADGKVFRIE